MKKGKTFIVSGPSGVGKSTVLQALLSKRDDLYFSVSATTRPAREGETDGVHCVWGVCGKLRRHAEGVCGGGLGAGDGGVFRH